MERVKKFIFPAVILLGLGAFVLQGRGVASDAEYTLARKPEVIAATFTSAWCSACIILEPRLSSVISKFSDKPVKFVEFDLTFGEQPEIVEAAHNAGIGEVYERFQGATGFTLLIDAETGEVIDSLTINHSKQAMAAAISQSIARAARDTSLVKTN